MVYPEGLLLSQFLIAVESGLRIYGDGRVLVCVWGGISEEGSYTRSEPVTVGPGDTLFLVQGL